MTMVNSDLKGSTQCRWSDHWRAPGKNHNWIAVSHKHQKIDFKKQKLNAPSIIYMGVFTGFPPIFCCTSLYVNIYTVCIISDVSGVGCTRGNGLDCTGTSLYLNIYTACIISGVSGVSCTRGDGLDCTGTSLISADSTHLGADGLWYAWSLHTCVEESRKVDEQELCYLNPWNTDVDYGRHSVFLLAAL